MAFKGFVILYVLLYFGSFHNEAMVKGNNLIDLNSELPPIKNILTKHGDTYNCVDIHKQASLKHPLLWNHTIQMRPSYKVRKLRAKMLSKKLSPGHRYAKIKLDEACPKGTVPVLRVADKDQLKNVSNLTKSRFFPNDQWNHGLEFAGIFAKTTPDKKYKGVSGVMTVWNPKNVGPNQYSSVAISAEVGEGPDYTRIQFGWTVFPFQFQDSFTHWFFQVTNITNVPGCFDLNCQGFVQINTQVPIGAAIHDVSEYGTDNQVFLRFSLLQDPEKESPWWLFYNEEPTPIGYFSNKLFTKLSDGADTLKWGGYVFTQPGDETSPQMGSGKFDNEIYQRTANMINVRYIDNKYELVNSPNDIQTAESRCYLEGDQSYKDDKVGYTFCFGGKGGTQEECSV